MLRTYSVIAAAIGLSLVSAGAMADHRHDKELSYVVGGALVGAAIGGLIYSDRYQHRHYGPTVHYRYYDRGYYNHGRPYGRYARSYRARHHHHAGPRHRHRHRH